MRGLILVVASGATAAAALASAANGAVQSIEPSPALTGSVVLPDGSPASSGNVSMRSGLYGGEAKIEARGRFRYEPAVAGTYEVHVNVPGFIARPLRVDFRRTRDLNLPPIRLSPAPYARVRIVSPTGEPIVSPRVSAASIDRDHGIERAVNVHQAIGVDRPATRIGPLPYGKTVLTIDQLPYARMHLPPLLVTGDEPLIDLGSIALEPGATLDVTLVDERGSPVVGQEVYINQPGTPAPTIGMPSRTDADGRATFDRLASGTYLVRTRGLRLCAGRVRPMIERSITTVGSGKVSTTINVGGFTRDVHVTWGGVPVGYNRFALIPQLTNALSPTALVAWRASVPLRDAMVETACDSSTDADGRTTITDAPAGRARVSVPILDSTWTRRVDMPPRASELSLDIPAGVVVVRAVNAGTGAPISGAIVTATSGGARIEARTTGNGAVILQGMADGALGMTIKAQGFRDAHASFDVPPDMLQEVALEPLPDTSLSCLVVAQSSGAVAGAVVEIVPQDPMEDVRIAVTDHSGIARVHGLPTGTVRVTASRDGYATGTASATIPVVGGKPVVVMVSPQP